MSEDNGYGSLGRKHRRFGRRAELRTWAKMLDVASAAALEERRIPDGTWKGVFVKH